MLKVRLELGQHLSCVKLLDHILGWRVDSVGAIAGTLWQFIRRYTLKHSRFQIQHPPSMIQSLKRLGEEGFEMYHATSHANALSILSRGFLLPSQVRLSLSTIVLMSF